MDSCAKSEKTESFIYHIYKNDLQEQDEGEDIVSLTVGQQHLISSNQLDICSKFWKNSLKAFVTFVFTGMG